MLSLKPYDYSEFKKYINELKLLLSPNQLVEINNNLKNRWNEQVNESICKTASGRYFTGSDATDKYYSQIISKNYPIKMIPKDCYNQVVIGIAEHLKDYFNSNENNEFLISSDMNWSQETNNIFVRCGLYGHLVLVNTH